MENELPKEESKIEFPDIPEMGEVDIGFWESAIPNLMLGLTVDPVEKARIIQEQFGGDERLGEVGVDKFGNPIITWKDEMFYVNKPGFSRTDVGDIVSQGTTMFPAAKYAGAGLSLAAKGARGLMGYGGTSYANQLGTSKAGGKEFVDPTQVGLEATVGAATEMAMPVIGRHVITPMGQAGKKYITDPISNTVKSMMPSFQPVKSATTAAAIEPVLTRAGEAQSKYPLTQGQRTQDAEQLAREDLLRNTPESAGYGRVKSFDDKQMDAIQSDVVELQPAGSGYEPDALLNVGQQTQDSLVSRAASLKKKGSDAYAKAAELSAEKPALLSPMVLDDAYERIAGVVKTMGFEPEQVAQMPNLKRAYDAVKKRISELEANPESMPFERFEGFRRSLNIDYGSAARGTPESKALRDMVQALDDATDDAITAKLIQGDPLSIQAIKDARAQWRRYTTFVGGDKSDPATAVMKKIVDPSKSTPEEVVRAIVGVSKIDNSAKTRNVLDRIIKEFGADSMEVARIKDAFLIRTFTNTKGNVSREAIHREVLNNLLKNQTVAKTLFNETERKRILQLARDVAPTLAAEQTRNKSGSGYTVIGSILDRYGVLTGPINEMRKSFSDIRASQRATHQGSVLPSLPIVSAPVTGAVAPVVEDY